MGITKHYQPKIFTYVKKEELNVDNKEKNGSLVVKAKNYEWIGHNVTSILTLAGAEVRAVKSSLRSTHSLRIYSVNWKCSRRPTKPIHSTEAVKRAKSF